MEGSNGREDDKDCEAGEGEGERFELCMLSCYLFPTTELGLGEVEHEVTKVDILWWLDDLGACLSLVLGELICRYGSKRSEGGGGREGVLAMR